jgi:anti-anti-sigma factor
MTKSGNVQLSAEERAGFPDYWRIHMAIRDDVQQDILAAANRIPAFETILRTTPPEVMEKQRVEGDELQRKAVLEDDWQPMLDNARTQGALYASLGVPFPAWLEVTTAFKRRIVAEMTQKLGSDPARMKNAILAMDRYIDVALAAIGDAYLQTKEELINKQQRAILELSTPVLPLRDRLLILPIVGVLDTRRARQLTEQLLHAIRDHRAKVVVVDITGVPAVDSKVANHLLQTVKAARLMGAKVVVTGLSPEVAQALVALGVELSTLHTVGDLQGGIELAEEQLGYRLVRTPTGREGADNP